MSKIRTLIFTLALLATGHSAFSQNAHVTINGSVFGGGNLANVGGNCTVLVDQADASIGTDVYGGGALAKANTLDGSSLNSGKSTTVTIKQGTVAGNVYGGGLGERPAGEDLGTAADVFGPVLVTVNGGTVTGSVFGCNNLYGAPQGTVNVDITQTGNAMTVHNVYGGGNLAAYTAPTVEGDPTAHNYPQVSINHGTVSGSVFGGGYGATAEVNGNPQVTIGDNNSEHTATVNGNVYGGGDLAAVTGSPYIKVWNTHSTVAHEVYGGGNQADVSSSTTVDVIEGTVSENVYGGGALANVGTSASDQTTVNILGGTVSGNVYGGGLGRKAAEGVTEVAAAVNGVVTVNIGALTGALDEDGFAPSASVTGSATIGGSVFGCNNTHGSPKDNVTVNIYKTAHTTTNQGTYTEDDGTNGDPTFALYQVFGGGNKANYEPASTGKKTTVHIWTCDNSIQYLYGGGNAADVGTSSIKSATDVVIDGGRMDWVFGGGNGAGTGNPGANIFGDVQVDYHSGYLNYIFGGSNEKGNVSDNKSVNILADGPCDKVISELYGGSNMALTTGNVNLTMGCQANTCKIVRLFGGSRMADITGNVTLTVNGGEYDYVFGGNNISGTISGNVILNLNGGTINEAAFGGNKGGGSVLGNITVNVEDTEGTCPLVVKDVFGAGDQAVYTAPTATGSRDYNPIVYVNHLRSTQTITGNVYGGGNGDSSNASQEPGMVTGNPEVVIGDANNSHYAKISGNVYGGGNAAKVVGATKVLMQNANSIVSHDVYGGGNLANVSGATDVDINGGTVTQDVYGGGALANTGGSDVTLGGGAVRNLYGGGLGQTTPTQIAAQVTGPVQVTVNSGTVNNVFGCNNYYGAPTSTVRVDVNNNVGGSVYGGGNLAAASVSPTVFINNGTVSGSVFAGGLGSTAVVTGNPSVTVGDLTAGHESDVATVSTDVYGGGDAADVAGATTVLIQKCNTVITGDVYGGGNAAHVDKNGNAGGTTSVTVTGGTISSAVYGGGHGDKDASPVISANVEVSTNVTINGGTINQVFGGSNSAGAINSGNPGGINVTVEKASDACDLHITEVYGGGNYAASQVGTIAIGCTGTVANANEGIQYLYGGANRANVTGNIALTIEEGRIANVFGGNNNSGTISGTITVNIEKKASPCVWEIGNVYGAGNLAAYTGSPAVNINNGTVSHSVFGGGKGSTAVVTGNPVVTVGDNNAAHCAIVSENVFGGGDAAAVTGNTSVTYNDANTSSAVAELFGGGNQAGVSGTAQVTLTNGTVTTGLYGGCNTSGTVGGNITVNVNGGIVGSQANLNNHVTADVFGGGYGQNTSTSGNVEVNVTAGTLYGDVYGGSAFGNVNDDANDRTTVNILDGTLETVTESQNIYTGSTVTGSYTVYHGGNVYGGCLGRKASNGQTAIDAKVFGQVIVNIGSGVMDTEDPRFTSSTSGNATIKGNIYGCNNTYGSPQQNVTVNIFKVNQPTGTGVNDTGYALNNVFGGGNEANFDVPDKEATVNVYGCDNTIWRTFGGGNAAATRTVNTMIQGGRILEAYGGGNGERGSDYAANVNGDVYLGIHGGNVGQSFGGSNRNGVISGQSHVTVDGDGCGDALIEEFFCGGNFADYYGDIDATIECAAGLHIQNLYGGCKQADVLPSGQHIGDVHLVVNGGTYENIYGGSQGRLAGSNPNLPSAESADINGNVHLEIHGGTVTNAIYGGSHILGVIKGNIVVDIENQNTGCELNLSAADVYGGGNQADYKAPFVSGTSGPRQNYPEVNIKNATVKNVFGGGLQAEVKGNPQINLKNKAKVLGNVYGGGNMGAVEGSPKVTVDGKQTN